MRPCLRKSQVITKAIMIHSPGNITICTNISACQSYVRESFDLLVRCELLL